jgi:ribosomal protein S18 acetylase RimI-like enzyme
MVRRKAQEPDVDKICAFDHIAQHQKWRRQFIHDSVQNGIAHVAVVDRTIVGYTVVDHSFFGRGFIAMLYVHSDHRRSGIGTALVGHAEGLCQSDRIFTSTNESNLPMQSLLQKLGYKRSGIVHDLDPEDPELFYSRQLKGADNKAVEAKSQ